MTLEVLSRLQGQSTERALRQRPFCVALGHSAGPLAFGLGRPVWRKALKHASHMWLSRLNSTCISSPGHIFTVATWVPDCLSIYLSVRKMQLSVLIKSMTFRKRTVSRKLEAEGTTLNLLFFLSLLLFLFLFWDSVVLCFLGCPWIHYMAQTDLELMTVFLPQPPWVLRLWKCTTAPRTPSSIWKRKFSRNLQLDTMPNYEKVENFSLKNKTKVFSLISPFQHHAKSLS